MLLARSGVPGPTAHLLSNHYNQTRTEYYRQLDRSSRANNGRGDPLEFLCYALQGFMDGVREQCGYVGRIQLAIAWEHLVFQTFHAQSSSSANTRRRDLVLALGATEHPVPKPHIPELTPALARAYATKTAKTLTCDLNWLRNRDLVQRTNLQARNLSGFRPYPERSAWQASLI